MACLLRPTAAAAAATMTRSTTARLPLTRFLTSPNKVAHALDWKKASGSLLSIKMDNNNTTLSMAVASHPVFGEQARSLPDICLQYTTIDNRKVLADGGDAVALELQRIVNQFNVCGVVVAFPLQTQGWLGAACGKVLHTLDQIQWTIQRPVCLYSPSNQDDDEKTCVEDEWGRCEVYSRVSHKSRHVASLDQYPDVTMAHKGATQVCQDFVQEHWPDLKETNAQQVRSSAPQSLPWDPAAAQQRTHLVNHAPPVWHTVAESNATQQMAFF
jgi:hypothetical protein